MVPPATGSLKHICHHTCSTTTFYPHTHTHTHTTNICTPPVWGYGELFRQVELRSVTFISSVNKSSCRRLQVCWHRTLETLCVLSVVFFVFVFFMCACVCACLYVCVCLILQSGAQKGVWRERSK